jgi:hypothetical protein
MNFYPDGLPIPERRPGVWYRSVSGGIPRADAVPDWWPGGCSTTRIATGRPWWPSSTRRPRRRSSGDSTPSVARCGTDSDSTADRFTVVGVVANTRTDGPNEPVTRSRCLVPMHQFTTRGFNVLVEPARNTEAAVERRARRAQGSRPSIPPVQRHVAGRKLRHGDRAPPTATFAIVVGSFARDGACSWPWSACMA